MKKKLIIAAAVICTLFAGTWIIGRITGMLQYYSIPTPSNEPNIKPGDKVFSSNLKDPLPYNFIVYTSEYSDSINMVERSDPKTRSRYIHRLCGVPGDIIEMKNGILYVNDKNFDKEVDLDNQFKTGIGEFRLIEQEDLEAMYRSGGGEIMNNDSAVVTFDNSLLKKYRSKINLVQYIMPHSEYGPFKWNNKNEYWTADNFGPLEIPTGCYFVLGDNRHNALDSRYIGYVKKENIKGVALNR